MPQSPSLDIRCLVGLGNPGPEYARTYHNAGRLALHHFFPEMTWKERREYAYARAGTLTLILPTTFMNESGLPVAAARRYFKLKPAQMLIVHDESDLPLGTAQLAFGRGPAGHRGVAAIIEALGTKDIWRLRLGIRTGRGKAAGFVLRPMTNAQLEILYSAAGGAMRNVITKLTPF